MKNRREISLMGALTLAMIIALPGCHGRVPSINTLPTSRPISVDTNDEYVDYKTFYTDHSYEEVFSAARQAAIWLELDLRREDYRNGVLLMNGGATPYEEPMVPVAIGVYVDEPTTSGQTRVDIYVRNGSWSIPEASMFDYLNAFNAALQGSR